MNELKINYDNESITLSARDLHKFLELDERFSKWWDRMSGYGFDENTDFNSYQKVQVQNEGNREVSRTIQDYEISLDMAKEISMLQRNDKGKQARKYFIDIEKQWNSPEFIMKRALTIANNQIKQLTDENQQLKPKALFADSVTASVSSILIGDLAKIICQNGINIGQKRLFEYLRENGYLIKHGDSKNMPTQRAMQLKLFEISEKTVYTPNGNILTTCTTKVTGKGQTYFVNKFLNNTEGQE